ncbi:MAG: GH92 family glycosyl hydrolase [Muribaculaceae bacterium]|nr:GH92 family glycosyl hydrolase [Muribaculaceae bacterium]
MGSIRITASTVLLIFSVLSACADRLTDFIDPRIGSEGLGRVFIGPCTPFGMVRPSPDCTPSPNSGWLPMPKRVDGFAQVHVSGTGGGPKYGNILLQPFSGPLENTEIFGMRESESILPAYYSTTYADSGIKTEITATDRTSAYRFSYPAEGDRCLKIDAGFFLGEEPVPDAREAQQFVGSEVQILSDTEIAGYSRIRGGWNNGRAYTVYFYAKSDTPFERSATWKGTDIGDSLTQFDSGEKTGALVRFPEQTDTVNFRVGISFISPLKARYNYEAESKGKTFDEIREESLAKWENEMRKIEVAPDTPEKHKRMLYTALYHTMLMPSDRTGENPLWTDPVPYYDDFYALWDTYRTSMPLLAIIEPPRLADMVNSLVNIGKRDGFMPDARSGNANGRTQGGSNADVVIADACVKGIPGIDYEAALKAMIHDATVPSGGNEEAEGRGGLREYLTLGYIPHGIARAGNRTVEYSLCDFAIAQVARRLGKQDIARRYMKQSESWKNLWRSDYEHDGARGFIMPRDTDGKWLDSIPFGHSKQEHPTFRYTPLTFEGPWYKPWWDMFFYEASAWEYSLSIPHDVPGLIEKCGGPDAFGKRLDTFFEKDYFNVNNEPSFLSPCLYHWIGRPDRSSEILMEIIAKNYSDSPAGLPGNDDSGAMSSWLIFNMAGIYPNAGHDYYLIHTPLLKSTTFSLPDGKAFTISAEGLSDKNRYITEAYLNGSPYPYSTLRHSDLSAGGELKLVMGRKPGKWGSRMFAENASSVISADDTCTHMLTSTSISDTEKAYSVTDALCAIPDTLQVAYKLHGQTRRFKFVYIPEEDGGMILHWSIVRNLKPWTGSYHMSATAVKDGNAQSYLMPEDGNHLTLPDNETFGIISGSAFADLKKRGEFIYNGVAWRYSGTGESPFGRTIEVEDPEEGARMTILDDPRLPLILSMRDNPLEIDWTMK